MINIYVRLIIIGRRTFSSVIEKDKAAVKAELQNRVAKGEITQEKYEELIAL